MYNNRDFQNPIVEHVLVVVSLILSSGDGVCKGSIAQYSGQQSSGGKERVMPLMPGHSLGSVLCKLFFQDISARLKNVCTAILIKQVSVDTDCNIRC